MRGQKNLDEEMKDGTSFVVKSDKFAIRYIRVGDRIKTPSNIISKRECDVGTNEDAKKEQNLLFEGASVFDFPKPESLLRYLIATATEPGDIVLDYHLGSGTTAAVAHKMGRQYIGIEQMDYIESIAVERLKKVIDGEQGGVSKAVIWQGGGGFVYCELKRHNEAFMQKIRDANSATALLKIWQDMKREVF